MAEAYLEIVWLYDLRFNYQSQTTPTKFYSVTLTEI